MRQHMRHAHREQYNADNELIGNKRKNFAWSDMEINRMANEEACFITDIGLLDHLVVFMNRSKDSIKGRRKLQSYKDLVIRLKSQSNDSELPIQSNDPELSTPIETSPIQNTPNINTTDSVLEYLSNIITLANDVDSPYSHLSNSDKECLQTVTSDEEVSIKTCAVDNWLNMWFIPLCSSKSKPREQTTKRTNQHQPSSNRKKRQMKFRIHQKLFKKNTKKLASVIFDNMNSEAESIPPLEDIRNEYNNIFSIDSPLDDHPFSIYNSPNINHYYPATVTEIVTAMNNSKSNSAGPDGISLMDIKKVDAVKIELLYNFMLFLGYTPKILSKSRTILIPKTKNDLHLIRNWRPISISSIVLRIFNKIINNRLNNIKLNDMQRGFMDIDGCLANNLTLQTFIKNKRTKSSPYAIISIDLKKAFDSVSHHTIYRALRRVRINQKIIDVIMSGYKNAETTISINGQSVGDFNIKRGVKQGDPLSPLLFNIVMDEVIDKINNINDNVSCMAYADDLILLSNNIKDCEILLNTCVNLLKERNLSVNPSKCHAVCTGLIPRKKKLYTVTNPQFEIDNCKIPQIGPCEFFKYLGLQYSDSGIECPSSSSVNVDLENLRKAALKPYQKLTMLTKHLIPRYIAKFQTLTINKKILSDVDKKIRHFTRRILHLYSHSSNAIFYTPRKHGGIGIFNFKLSIPRILKERIEKLRIRSEKLSNVLTCASGTLRTLEKLVIPIYSTKNKIDEQFASQLECGYSGNGIHQVKNAQASHSFFLYPPKFWNGEDYVNAINLRFNLLPTKSMPSVPREERKCRAGCYANETLCHVLQKCPLTHRYRVSRHDHIIKRLVPFAEKNGWKTMFEAHIRLSNGSLKKPDLIFANAEKVIVCDVGVHWEGPQNLNHSYHNKIATYGNEEFINKLRDIFPTQDIFICPIIVGARGTWCSLNKSICSHLSIPKYIIANIIHTTIKGSIIAYKAFMRSCWEK